jgi:hypothetical protein
VEAEGILTAIAEVAIAIVGFSGIVVVLDRSEVPWSKLDSARLSMLLQISIACVFWSFAPILLHLADVSAASIWFWSSGLWIAFTLAGIGVRVRTLSQLEIRDQDPSVRWLLAFMFSTLAMSVAVQAVNVAWLMAPWPHVFAMLQGLLVACLFFVRLLSRVITPAV